MTAGLQHNRQIDWPSSNWWRRGESNPRPKAQTPESQSDKKEEKYIKLGAFSSPDISLSATVCHLSLEHSWNIFWVATLTPLDGSAPQYSRTLEPPRSHEFVGKGKSFNVLGRLGREIKESPVFEASRINEKANRWTGRLVESNGLGSKAREISLHQLHHDGLLSSILFLRSEWCASWAFFCPGVGFPHSSWARK